MPGKTEMRLYIIRGLYCGNYAFDIFKVICRCSFIRFKCIGLDSSKKLSFLLPLFGDEYGYC